MKKLYYLLFAGLLATSCVTIGEAIEDELGPTGRIKSGKATAQIYTSDRSDSNEVWISYQYYNPMFSTNLMDSLYKDSVNAIIEQLTISETFSDGAFWSGPLTDHFFQSRLDSFAAEAQEEVDFMESFPWSLEMGFTLTGQGTYVRLTASGWSYTGGAHGNGNTSYYLVDKKTGKTLKVEDFFTDRAKLNEVAQKYYRLQNDIPDDVTLEEYGLWFEGNNFDVNENFYFTENSVCFYFNTYEIAPYAGGPSEVVIPLSELKEIYTGKY